MTRTATVLAATIAMLSCAPLMAATLVLPGIPSFDTNLGTLNLATVTINPLPTTSSTHDVSFFTDIDGHVHSLPPISLTVSGLFTFNFAAPTVSFEDPGQGDSHSHVIDLPATGHTFAGPNLQWFLNPSNGISNVTLPSVQTSPAEGHQHSVAFPQVFAQTVFTYTPVPEPSAALLALLASGCLGLRRR